MTAVFPFPFRSARGAERWEGGSADQPQLVEAAEIIVADRYFETLRINLRAGRLFSPADAAEADPD